MTSRDLRSAWHSIRDTGDATSNALEDESAWWRAVVELLWGDAEAAAEVVRSLKFGPLATAGQCAAASPASLMAALEEVPRGPQKSSVLIRLAQWWGEEFGDDDSPEWRADIEHYRAALRSIRGIGPETADRLLLFAAGRTVFPVDRAILRIAVRHGWLDWPVDDESAQSSLVSAFGSDVPEMQFAARRLKAIGAEFCGRVPKCEACPLKSWLPEPGPLFVDQC
ncbi:MAG TPA: endonuclease III domain-containing protein [Planctomycetaceae bacterium]|nr:endonuclease III domain-containing protein [Planctomycetaceae bacterium]